MNVRVPYSSREEQANAEVGMTAVSRTTAWWAVGIFLATIVAVPIADRVAGGWPRWRELEERSAVGRVVRPVVQRGLNWAGVTGVDKVYRGRNGWLFYAPDVAHVTIGKRPSSEAIATIEDFKRQLARRGVTLIIMPTPVKPTVHPEMLWARSRAPIENASFARFAGELRARGVLVYDATPESVGRDTYLAGDTHWRPEGVEIAAAGLATFVNERVELPQSLGVEYRREALRVRRRGDLAAMIGSDATEDVMTQQVSQPDGSAWAPTADAEILWLGDSFSNIYSADAMGWGSAAGVVEQFSFHLGRPVDAIRRNDNGAIATRRMLADDLARGNDRLAGKKLVIWQFAARELSFGDWRPIEMTLGTRPARRFLVPPAGETWTVDGVVLSKGVSPRPGNVAYRDHILAVRVGAIVRDGNVGGEAIVYLRSMIDGKLTDAAGLRAGERVRLKLRDWSAVARQYEFINRSDLPEAELRTQAACWGELLR